MWRLPAFFLKSNEMKKTYIYNRGDYQRIVLRTAKTVMVCEFKGGNVSKKVKPEYSTKDPLIQYSIEHSPRFGKDIMLKSIDGKAPDVWLRQQKAAAATVAPVTAEAPAKPSKPSKKKGAKEEPAKPRGVVVEDVRTMNDAIDYFANLGKTFGNEDELNALCADYGVNFPNLKK